MLYAPGYSTDTQGLIQRLRLVALAVTMTGVTGLCAGLLYLGRPSLAAALVAVVFGGVALLRWPWLGFYGVLGAALLFDQAAVDGVTQVTVAVPFWRTFSGITPGAVILGAALALLAVRRAHGFERPVLRTGPLIVPVAGLTAAVCYGVARGLTFWDPTLPGGFDLAAAVNETAALCHIPLAYLLALNVVRTPRDVNRALWVALAASGMKTAQMVWTAATLRMGVFSLREIATHEDSLFLSSLVLLALGLAVCGGSARLRRATYALLPFVAVALIANHRRAGFVALGVGLTVCGALLLADARVRRWALRAAPVALLLGAVYAAAFWNQTGPLAFPVYSVRSIFDPRSEQDLRSNTWREMENINIERTIERAPVLGIGFGRRYAPWILQPSIDESGFTYWRYISHNAIYWVWMKMGVVGFAVFWYLIAATLALGCVVFRRLAGGEMKAAALMAVGLIAMQMVFSYADLGLTSARNTVYLGSWMGIIAALAAIAGARAVETGDGVGDGVAA